MGASEGGSINTRQASVSSDGHGGLFLLFASGDRPDAAVLRAAVARLPRLAISHDPARAADAPVERPDWLELLLDGMTFDLSGLAPGKPETLPELTHYFDCPDDLLDGRTTALRLAPGPHLAGGAASLPVARALAGLASLLSTELPKVSAIAWGPSTSLIGPAYFRTAIESWLGGGPFPALGLTAFRATLDHGLQSVGLGFFTGQELRIEPELAGDRTVATRLAVRLINLLIGTGKLESAEHVTAPDGAALRLEPSANGRFVRVFGG